MSRAKCKSIYDLAQQTGVSASTVSRVLNQRGRISAATRKKVLNAARANGFRPRVSARQFSVAIVLDRLRYSTYGGFVTSLLTHLVDELSRHDIAVEIYSENSFEQLGSRFIDGVIAMSWDDSTVAQMQALENIPVVLLNRMDLPQFSSAATDHAQGGRLVGDYLCTRGHRRIAFLAEEKDWGATDRLAGLRESLQAHGTELDDGLIGWTQHQPLYGVLKRLVAQGPTALFLAGEDLSLEASFILSDVLGVRIPEQLSVMGLENAKVSPFTRPPQTTLRQPLDKLAADAMKLLLDLVETGARKPRQAILENDIVERESVKSV